MTLFLKNMLMICCAKNQTIDCNLKHFKVSLTLTLAFGRVAIPVVWGS